MSKTKSEMNIEVSGVDINDVDADIVALPIDSRLLGDRRPVQAVLAGCAPAVRDSLSRLAAVIPTGIAPGAVIVFPAQGHKRFKVVLLVVLFDNRDAKATTAVVEPDEARIQMAAAALWRTLAGVPDARDGRLALVSFAGRTGDAGEAAATVVRAFQAASKPTESRSIVFVEHDPIYCGDVRAALVSIGIDLPALPNIEEV